MPYPTPPEIATNYSAQEQALGDGSLPGQELDVDLAAIRASATATIEFLKGITRSDGKLANGIVTKESLASSLVIGFDTPEIWASGTDYTTSSLVFEGVKLYICLVPHTSTVFATDLASGRWDELVDLTPPGGALIASNNLSDLGDAANARVNLGLGSMATASASAYRTNVENDLVYQAILTGLTASVAELNILDGVTATATELNRVAGVTSPIQTQLNGKQAEVLTTNGDIVVRSGGATTRLPVGAEGTSLRVVSGAPAWAAGAGNVLDSDLDTGAATAAGIAWVGLRTAGLAVGAVGTYALMRLFTGASGSPGATYAGSALRFTNASGNQTGTAGSGTWRLMGAINDTPIPEGYPSLFLRIS